jgi:hypothetical protein
MNSDVADDAVSTTASQMLRFLRTCTEVRTEQPEDQGDDDITTISPTTGMVRPVLFRFATQTNGSATILKYDAMRGVSIDEAGCPAVLATIAPLAFGTKTAIRDEQEDDDDRLDDCGE